MGQDLWTYTVCPESSDPFYILTYYIKWVTTSLDILYYVSKKKVPILFSKITT